MYLGAHVSIAGGFDKSIDRIADLGGQVLMTFASSPRSLRTTPFKPEILEKYKIQKSKKAITHHFFHGIYLVNLASQNADLVKQSIDSLIFYQQLAREIEAVGTIFHIGSHKGAGFETVITKVVTAVNYILDSSPRGTKLILENCAGQAGTIGSTFAEIREIIDRIGDKPKIGVCLDTQHAFASGIPLNKALDLFGREVGLKYLVAVHLNDSKTDFDSHVDRHENLGKGKIGKEALGAFLNDKRLANIPIILEVPGDGQGPRKKDLDYLKNMLI